jgi:hypothetical protein
LNQLLTIPFLFDPCIDQLKPTVAPLDLDELQALKCLVRLKSDESTLSFQSAPVGSKRGSEEHPFAISAEMQHILNVQYVDYELGCFWRHFANARANV